MRSAAAPSVSSNPTSFNGTTSHHIINQRLTRSEAAARRSGHAPPAPSRPRPPSFVLSTFVIFVPGLNVPAPICRLTSTNTHKPLLRRPFADCCAEGCWSWGSSCRGGVSVDTTAWCAQAGLEVGVGAVQLWLGRLLLVPTSRCENSLTPTVRQTSNQPRWRSGNVSPLPSKLSRPV